MMSKKGLVFYYDWLEQLLKLNNADLREALSAIVLYHKNGELPPKLSGLADMALGFILPQIDRMKEKAECGKLGGRPKKEELQLKELQSSISKGSNNNVGKSKPSTETDDLMVAALEKKLRLDERRRASEWALGRS